MKAQVEEFYATFKGNHFYKDIPMICAPGVHELVAESAQQYLTEPGASVLDVGCGQGALALRLSDLGYDVEACDIFDRCQCKDVVKFTRTSAEDAQFDRMYDAVFIIELIEHVEAPFDLLRQYARYVKPGGHLFVSTPNVESDHSRVWFALKGEHWFFRQHDFDHSGHIMPFHRFQLDYVLPFIDMTLLEERGIPDKRAYRPGLAYIFAKLLRLCQALKAAPRNSGAVRLWVLQKKTGTEGEGV